MKLVVGLGNPGPRYVGTRHNAGYRVALALAERCGLEWVDSPYRGKLARGRVAGATGGALAQELAVLMPTTFMNASGESVRCAVEALGIVPESELLIAFDDLDLPLGRLRLRAGGGCGGHRGMESIAAALATERFARIRFGIGRPASGSDLVDYVLSPFGADEDAQLPAHVERATDAIVTLLDRGIDAAMERYNRFEDDDENADDSKSSGHKNI